MDAFSSSEFRLLRLAARLRPYPSAKRRSIQVTEVVSLVEHLINEGFYADEFAYLDDRKLSYPFMYPILEELLKRLNWRPLSEEGEYRFMTALYARAGQENDVTAYHAMIRWMDDVGREMGLEYDIEFVADRIGAERIYGCYYSYSNAAGGDLIPSIKNPSTFDWESVGEARPKTIFSSWLMRHPNDFDEYQPIEFDRLEFCRGL